MDSWLRGQEQRDAITVGAKAAPSPTWKTSSTAESDKSPAQRYIILVHGFGGSRSSFRQCFKKWRRKRNKEYTTQGDSTRIKRFQFHAGDIIRHPRNIANEAIKLLDMVSTLETKPPPLCQGSSSDLHITAPDEVNIIDNIPTFIFVAHGIGAWVVRMCFTMALERGVTLVANTIAAVWLDVPELDRFRGLEDYKKYLDQLRHFSKVRAEDYQTLGSSLKIIDQEHGEAVSRHRDAKRYIHEEYRHIWDVDLNSKTNQMSPMERRFSRLQAWWRRQRDDPKVEGSLSELDNLLEQVLERVKPVVQDTSKDPVKMSKADEPGTAQSKAVAQANSRALEPGTSTEYLRQDSVSFPSSTWLDQSRPASYLGNAGNEMIVLSQYTTLDPTSEADLDNLLSLARTCLMDSELKRADELLIKGKAKLRQYVNDDDNMGLGRESPEIAMRLTQMLCEVSVQQLVVHIELGQYGPRLLQDGQDVLSEIDKYASRYKSGEEGYLKAKAEAQRWLCRATFLSGNYSQAERDLIQLLASPWSQPHPDRNVILLRRDLAITNAHLGNYRGCKYNIETAKKLHRELLDTVSSQVSKIADKSKATRDEELWLSESQHLRGIEDSIRLDEASIEFLCGNYPQALDKAKRASRGMIRHFGQTNVRALESAKLSALLLALNSNVAEAEAMCRDALQSMETELGAKHPQTLETMSILVFIFRVQARLVEAVGISKSVCERMEVVLTANHPRTLEARVELAANYRSAGDYALAQKELEDVVKRSFGRYGASHPSTLRDLSELVHTYYRSGFFAAAEELALDVLYRQFTLYTFPRQVNEAQYGTNVADTASPVLEQHPMAVGTLDTAGALDRLQNKTTTVIEDIIMKIHYEYVLLKQLKRSRHAGTLDLELPRDVRRLDQGDIFRDTEWIEMKERELYGRLGFSDKYQRILDNAIKDIEDAESYSPAKEMGEKLEELQARYAQLSVHPNLLHTLQILASILLQKDAPQELLAEDILFSIWRWKAETLGSCNFSTLISEFELAKALRQRRKLREALELFYNVCISRFELLGEGHPDTLSAKLELFITKCAAGEWEGFDAMSVFSKTALDIEISIDAKEEPQTQSSEDSEFVVQKQDENESVEFYSRDILRSLEARLGKLHPEALKTLLWVFIVQLDSGGGDSNAADETAKTLLERLRDPEVRKQRRLESTQMEDKVAQFFEAYENQRKGADVRGVEFHESERRAQEEVENVDNFIRNLREEMAQASHKAQVPLFATAAIDHS